MINPEYNKSKKKDLILYWKNKIGIEKKILKIIIYKFLHNNELNFKELLILKIYIYDWINAMPLKPNKETLNKMLNKMNQQDLVEFLDEIQQYGIDPF